MVSGPPKVETVQIFVFLGSQITVDGDCSHKIKILAPWKENYDKPGQYIKKQRHHFADKGLNSQSYGFSIVVYRSESFFSQRRLGAKELMLSNCGAGKDS